MLRLRPMGDASDADCLGSGHSRGAAYFSLWRELILCWLIPYTFIFSTLNYWSEVGDHFRVSGAKTRSDLNWFVNTFISHNIGYHALHHKYSSIPWFRLPEAYRVHKAEIVEQVSHGYWETFVQIIAYTPPLRAGSRRECLPPAGPQRRSGREEAICISMRRCRDACIHCEAGSYRGEPGRVGAPVQAGRLPCALLAEGTRTSRRAAPYGPSAGRLLGKLAFRGAAGTPGRRAACRGPGDLARAARSRLRGACPALRRHFLQLPVAECPPRWLLLPPCAWVCASTRRSRRSTTERFNPCRKDSKLGEPASNLKRLKALPPGISGLHFHNDLRGGRLLQPQTDD